MLDVIRPIANGLIIRKSVFVPPNAIAWVPWKGVILWNVKYPITIPSLAHELVHIDQWEEYGWTFLPRYVWQWVTSGVRWKNIRFEQEAIELGETFFYQEWARIVINARNLL